MELDGAWSPYRRLESILWTLYKSPFNDTINKDALWWHVLSLQHVLSLKFDALPACFVTPARFVTTGWQKRAKRSTHRRFCQSTPHQQHYNPSFHSLDVCQCVCVCVCVFPDPGQPPLILPPTMTRRQERKGKKPQPQSTDVTHITRDTTTET